MSCTEDTDAGRRRVCCNNLRCTWPGEPSCQVLCTLTQCWQSVGHCSFGDREPLRHSKRHVSSPLHALLSTDTCSLTCLSRRAVWTAICWSVDDRRACVLLCMLESSSSRRWVRCAMVAAWLSAAACSALSVYWIMLRRSATLPGLPQPPMAPIRCAIEWNSRQIPCLCLWAWIVLSPGCAAITAGSLHPCELHFSCVQVQLLR